MENGKRRTEKVRGTVNDILVENEQPRSPLCPPFPKGGKTPKNHESGFSPLLSPALRPLANGSVTGAPLSDRYLMAENVSKPPLKGL
jgi:hypothetical protein